jgi:hypothetical protein
MRTAIAGETHRPPERCAGVGYPTPRTKEPVHSRRDPFLEALTGQARSRAVAADVIEKHLAADRAPS